MKEKGKSKSYPANSKGCLVAMGVVVLMLFLVALYAGISGTQKAKESAAVMSAQPETTDPADNHYFGSFDAEMAKLSAMQDMDKAIFLNQLTGRDYHFSGTVLRVLTDGSIEGKLDHAAPSLDVLALQFPAEKATSLKTGSALEFIGRLIECKTTPKLQLTVQYRADPD